MSLTARNHGSTLPAIMHTIFSILQGFFLVFSALYAGALYWTTVITSSFSLDFNPYYLAGRAVLAGLGTSVYNADVLVTLASGVDLGPYSGVVDYTYPPPFLFIALPFALMPYPVARTLWLLFNLFCFVASLLLLIRMLNIRISWQRGVGYWIGLLLIAFPIYDTFLLGQANSIIFLCLTLCYLLSRQGRHFSAGIALSSAVAFKFTAIPLLIYFLARKQWSAVTGCLLGLTAWFGASILLFGPNLQLHFIQMLRTWNLRYLGMSTNVSPAALISRAFAYLSNLDPLSVDDATFMQVASQSSFFYPMLFLCTLLIALIVFLFCCKAGNQDLLFALAITGTVLISNLTWFHHLIVLFIPALILLSLHQQQPTLLKHYSLLLLVLFIALILPPVHVLGSDNSIPWLIASVSNFLLIGFFISIALALRLGSSDNVDTVKLCNYEHN